jgi:hypothetical protein
MSDDINPYAAIIERHRDWIEPGGDRHPFPMFGFEVERGWINILGRLFDDIADIVRPTGRKLHIRQIKEKFGTLRFYWSGPFDGQCFDRICEAVELAQFRSEATCEECGAPGALRNAGGWYAVRCDRHAARRSRKIEGKIGHFSGNASRDEYWRVTYDPDTDTVTRQRLTRDEFERLVRSRDDE